MADSAALEEKDVPMEDVAEVDEDELLGTEKAKNGEELDESMKDINLEGDSAATATPAATDAEEKPATEEKKEEDEDDGGAASDAEFANEDNRTGHVDESNWTWHVELYPLAPEDIQLENFGKMVNAATQSHVVYRTNDQSEKKGEAHFYTHDIVAAKSVMRTLCCRKFNYYRPYVYLYRKKEGGENEFETAVMRLDLIEAAKMRWDRQRKNKGTGGEPASRVAKVSGVPLGTSKDFLNVLFARAFHVKRESDQSEAEEVKKVEETEEKNDEAKAENSTAEKKEEKDEEDKEENNEEEELVGEFNGNLTIDCCTRTSLKGFLLGYRKVTIGSTPLDIQPLSPEEMNMDTMRKDLRAKRRYEAVHGKEWTPVTNADRASFRDDDGDGRNNNRGRGRGGRGGRGDHRGGNRGGVMTGRQKMNEKSVRRGYGREMPRGGRGAGAGARGGGYRDEMRSLQSQLQMNTYELQRQIASLHGRERGYGGGYRDYAPDPYDMPPMRGGPMDRGYGGGGGGYGGMPPHMDSWEYQGGQRYGGGGGGGRGKSPRGKPRR